MVYFLKADGSYDVFSVICFCFKYVLMYNSLFLKRIKVVILEFKAPVLKYMYSSSENYGASVTPPKTG